MKLQEIRVIAKGKGISAPGRMKKGEAIRAIQRAEGYRDCFGSAITEQCGRTDCLWRNDCLTPNVNGRKAQ